MVKALSVRATMAAGMMTSWVSRREILHREGVISYIVRRPHPLGSHLELDVGAVLMPAPLTAAAFGQGPADFEAVAVLMALIPGDLHAGGQVHVDRHACHD